MCKVCWYMPQEQAQLRMRQPLLLLLLQLCILVLQLHIILLAWVGRRVWLRMRLLCCCFAAATWCRLCAGASSVLLRKHRSCAIQHSVCIMLACS